MKTTVNTYELSCYMWDKQWWGTRAKRLKVIFGVKPLSWHSADSRSEYEYSLVTIFVHPFAKKIKNLISVVTLHFYSYYYYLTVDNYFDIRGIEKSNQKNRKKPKGMKRGDTSFFKRNTYAWFNPLKRA